MCSFNAAPVLLNFSRCSLLELTLQTEAALAFQVNSTNFTLQAMTNGTISIYGSFYQRSPNPVTADFVIQGSQVLSYYVGNSNIEILFLTVVPLHSHASSTTIAKEDIFNTVNIAISCLLTS